MNEKQKKILQEYLKGASIDEARELHDLLDRKEKETPIAGIEGLNIDVNKLARNMSGQIQEQMGMANLNIKRMAVDMVVQMARQKEPNISAEELAVLVEQMVPDGTVNRESSNIPTELLRDMIDQFVSYGRGEFSKRDSASLPDGWAEKYWDHFPEKIQKVITANLTGVIDEDQFSDAVNYILEVSAREKPVGSKRAGAGNRSSGRTKARKKGGMPSPPGPRKNPC